MLRPDKVLPLTSVRFFAAFSIVLNHFLEASYPRFANTRWVAPVRIHSGTAVFLFFILSGYILSMVYLRGSKAIDRRKFWIARFARIYPLYFVTICIGALTLLKETVPVIGFHAASLRAAKVFLENVPLVQHWFPEIYALNFPAWSISTEMFFYAVFPWLGLALWRLSVRKALLGAIFVTIAIHVTAHYLPPGLVAHVKPILYLHFFIAGIVLARCHVALMQWEAGNDYFVRHAFVLFVAAFATLLALIEFLEPLGFGDYLNWVCIPLYALIIGCLASGNSLLNRLFAPAWLVILGESSYGLYLIHVPVYQHCCLTRFGQHPSHLIFQLYVAGGIALSVLSFHYFETPVRKWILRSLSTRPKESIAEASIAQ